MQLIDPPDNCSIFEGIIGLSVGPVISGKDLIFVTGSSNADGNTSGLYRTTWNGLPNGPYDCSNPTELVPHYLAYYGTSLPGDPNGPGNNGFG